MPNELLDEHEINRLIVRKPYYDLLEYIIMICNLIFLVGGVAACWRYAIAEEIWLLLINPPIFIVIFSIPVILFVQKWRKVSKAYEVGDFSERWNASNGFTLTFVHLVTGIIFNLAFFITSIFNLFPPRFSFLFFVWLVTIGLGPIQYFYLRKVKKLLIEINNKI